MVVSKIYSVECPTYGLVNSSYWGRPLMVQETFTTAEGARRLGGLGACPPPRKFLDLKDLKCHFQNSQADGCVKKLPKILYFLFNFHKKIVVISCVSKIYNYCGTPFNARKIRYQFLTKDQEVHSVVLLYIYAPRVYSQLAGKKIVL